MLWLAYKTLLFEKGRLFITIVGIAFSTVLVLTQVGIYLGMMGNATSIIRNIDADIWVTSRNIQNFDFANPMPEERINRVRAISDVKWADRMIMTWGFLKLQGGGQEQVQIIGFNPDTGVGSPWSMLSGKPSDVKGGSYMIIDKTSEQRLGSLKIGSVWELSGKRFKLVGISEGIKSFTTAPIVFMSYEQAQNLPTGLTKPSDSSYIVAKLKNAGDANRTINYLKTSMKDNDIFTKNGFILKTIKYWTIQTGIGMGFFLTAILGLMIGGAIVGQTIYSSTMEHIREYGTLKALGARNEDVYEVIFWQAGINAFVGFVAGTLLILLLGEVIEKAGVPMYLDLSIILSLFFIILIICLSSAYFSVKKIKNLDPMMVFRT